MTVEIRRLTEEDAAAWQEIRLGALREYPENFGMTAEEEAAIPLEFIERRFKQDLAGEDRFILGAFDGDDLIAIVGFDRQQLQQRRHIGVMWGIFVAASHRKKGVARSMLSDLLERARNIPGITHIRVTTNADNEGAKKLYSSLGFASWGVEPHALLVKGKLHDEEHFALDLDEDG